jgi:cell division protein FtsQ
MEIKAGKANRESESPAVSVPPDRGSARKKTVQKPQRSRKIALRLFALFKILAVVTAIVLVAAGALFLGRYAHTSDLLTLRNITIDGCGHLDPSGLAAVIRQSFPPNVLQIDLNRLRERLEQEPWIKKAEIRRILPGSLKVYIQERVPSVIAEIGGELVLLDNEGVLLDQYGPSYGKLDVPVFRGLRGDNPLAYKVLQEDNTARVRLGIQVLTELEAGLPDSTRSISEIDLSDPSNVRILTVEDSTEVRLGSRDFFKRFQAFLSEYQSVKSRYGECSWVDLRFDGQIVYQVRQHTGEQVSPGTVSR